VSEVSLQHFIEASRLADLDLTSEEFADVCWLAATTARKAGLPRDERRAQALTTGPGAEMPPATPLSSSLVPDPERAGAPGGEAGDAMAAMRAAQWPERRMPPGLPGVPLRSPAAPALAGRLALARSLRPLKRKIPSRMVKHIDEAATACQAAETDLWLPVLRPTPDRWLDLSVVVDDVLSMMVWRRTVAELLRMLEESGAFRSVRVWRCNSDDDPGVPLTLRGETAVATSGRDPRELIDAARHRMILVVSDCVGAGWRDRRMAEMLGVWGAAGLVTVIDLLPQRMWAQSGPWIVPVQLRSIEPATSNAQLQCRCREFTGDANQLRIPVPVLELNDRWLSDWSEMLAGVTGWTNSMAIITDAPVRDDEDSTGVEEELDPAARVARFRAQASPQAFRLATLLAAAAPLRLPVMRLIQQTLTGGSRPVHLAEIFLSDLLNRVSSFDADLDPDETDYDFRPGVREILLARLTRSEALRVLAEVSIFVTERLGMPVDFLAVLTTNNLPPPVVERSQPFALVALHVLRALGGVYAEKADLLERQLGGPISDSSMISEDAESSPTTLQGDATAAPTDLRNGDYVTTPEVRTPRGYTGQSDTHATVQGGGVPPRNVNFTGRTDLLRQLRETLLNPSRSAVLVPRALYGLGGVGKTQLAIEYAYRYAYDYDLIWWIPAEEPADVRRSLVLLAAELKLPESSDTTQTVQAVLGALESGQPRRWLLIFDNADEPERLGPFTPRTSGHGHVLITSRNQAWAAQGQALEVDVFTRAESTSLLRRRGKDISLQDADRLAELLGDLPLALEQAAAWHVETGRSVADYLQLYEDKLKELPEERPTQYSRPVAAALGVTIDRLGQGFPAGTQLLELCAHFGAEPITVKMLWHGRYASGIPSPLDRTMRDQRPLRRLLNEMGRHALVRFDTVRDRFQVHRMVQAMVRASLSPEQRASTSQCAQRMLTVANPGNPDDIEPAELARHAELSPHIVPSGIISADDEEARRVVLDQIRSRYVVGDYESSRDLAQTVVEVWEKRWGTSDELTLLARRHLANTIRALGFPAEALAMDEETVAAFRRTLGEDHDHTLATANSLGADLRAVGQFLRALELDKENLARHNETLGPDDLATLRTANNYAVDLRLLGDFVEARRLDEDTTARRRELYGGEHQSTLFGISNVVRDMYGLGEYSEALTLQESVLPIHEAVRGSGHPDVMLAKRSVAALYRKLGRYSKGREMAETNFVAYKTRFGENHEHTLAAMMSWSNALREDDRVERALEVGNDALNRYRQHFSQHPFVDVCAANVAIVLRRVGDVPAARKLNEESYRSLSRTLGERHPYTLCCAANLSNDLAAMNDYGAASDLSASTLSLSREVRGGDDHPYTLACANNYAIDLGHLGEEAQGQELSADTVRRFTVVLGPDHPDTNSARDHKRIDCDIEPPPT
jgi:hypothetical protein